MSKRILAVAAMLLAGPVTWADEYVNKADANGDGFVSLHELRAAYYADPAFNERIEASFAALDRNGDGRISADERRAGREMAAAPVSPPAATAGGLRFEGQPAPVAPTPDSAPVAAAGAAAQGGASSASARATPGDRFDAWIADVDVDDSGSASAAELLGGGGGAPWFSRAEFEAADRNGDDELDAAELSQLVTSLERRRR